MGTFQILEHTSEIGILARGETIAEAFGQAATGMFSIMVQLEAVEERGIRRVEIDAPDIEALLVTWLNELIYLFEVEGLVFNRAQIPEISSTHLKALCYGEKLDLDRHHFHIAPKAATYHMLEVVEEPLERTWQARVVLDI